MSKLVFIDTETGGLRWYPSFVNDKIMPMNPITQIASITIDSDTNETVDSFGCKIIINTNECEVKALQINHYNSQVWEKEGIPEKEARLRLSAYLKNNATTQKTSQAGSPYSVAQMAGHNCVGFDFPYIQAWYKKVNEFLPADYHIVDTMSMAVALRYAGLIKCKDFKLQTLCEIFGIKNEDAHDAMSDVKATVEIYKIMMNILKGRLI